MPTGYTADVGKGKITDFNEFVWLCARGFGALIALRDEPMNAPIPEKFEPSDYYREKQVEATERVMTLASMTQEQVADEAAGAYLLAEKNLRQHQIERRTQRQNYESMLEKVKKWDAPNRNHEGLKKFMVEQLSQSISFDCSGQDIALDPDDFKPEVWLKREIDQAKQDELYYSDQYIKEVERTNERNKWLADLRASVPMPKRVVE